MCGARGTSGSVGVKIHPIDVAEGVFGSPLAEGGVVRAIPREVQAGVGIVLIPREQAGVGHVADPVNP